MTIVPTTKIVAWSALRLTRFEPVDTPPTRTVGRTGYFALQQSAESLGYPYFGHKSAGSSFSSAAFHPLISSEKCVTFV